jgi:hypothetical protein
MLAGDTTGHPGGTVAGVTGRDGSGGQGAECLAVGAACRRLGDVWLLDLDADARVRGTRRGGGAVLHQA